MNHFRERLESQYWLRINGFINDDYWRMKQDGEIKFYPLKPEEMEIENKEGNK